MSFLYSSAVDRAVLDHIRSVDGTDGQILLPELEIPQRKKTNTTQRKKVIPLVQIHNLPEIVQVMSARKDRAEHQSLTSPSYDKNMKFDALQGEEREDHSPRHDTIDIEKHNALTVSPSPPRFRPAKNRRTSLDVA